MPQLFVQLLLSTVALKQMALHITECTLLIVSVYFVRGGINPPPIIIVANKLKYHICNTPHTPMHTH